MTKVEGQAIRGTLAGAGIRGYELAGKLKMSPAVLSEILNGIRQDAVKEKLVTDAINKLKI